MRLDSAPLFVRVDASAAIGIGHFMRCLALAQCWREAGGAVTFLGTLPERLVERLRAEGIEHVAQPQAHPDPRDLSLTLERVPSGAWLVLDGYHLDADYQRALCEAGRRLLVIDDTGHLPAYAGEVLLNANLDAERIAYAIAPAQRLFGPRHALLARAFRRHAAPPRAVEPKAERILITCGGSDPGNATLAVLESLRNEADPQRRVRVLVGPANPHRESLRRYCSGATGNYELIEDAPDLPELFAWADLAIAAAGTTTFELARLGVPMVLVAIAHNQLGQGAALGSRGAALYCGPIERLRPGELGRTIAQLARDPRARAALGAAARKLVDGQGALRVVEALQRRSIHAAPKAHRSPR